MELSFMARKWCGFLPQNDAIRTAWSAVVALQGEDTEIVDWESEVSEETEGPEDLAEENEAQTFADFPVGRPKL